MHISYSFPNLNIFFEPFFSARLKKHVPNINIFFGGFFSVRLKKENSKFGYFCGQKVETMICGSNLISLCDINFCEPTKNIVNYVRHKCFKICL